jgi:hypothetical protein
MTGLCTSILAFVLLLPALASAQDLKAIAGKWAGEGGLKGATGGAFGYSNAGPVELTIAEDGSAEFLVGRNRVKAPATFRVQDGKFHYETAQSNGVATLIETGGKRILKGDSVRKDRTGEGWFEMKPKE